MIFKHIKKLRKKLPLSFDYKDDLSLEEFNKIELEQQEFIEFDFKRTGYHLFTKYYSGTYWSFEQCLWIDGIRFAAEKYSNSAIYYPILSSLMFAMAYNAQSTGHYAQYRDAHKLDSMNDIIIYRKKEILPYFEKKLKELISWNSKNNFNHSYSTLDYRECLEILPKNSLIYADPPYTFVHYSRFYHAIETLVKYDYPNVFFKGRYRDDRHQSPFCKRTEVKEAFSLLFEKVKKKSSKLVLSYSNSGMIPLDGILELMDSIFEEKYKVEVNKIDYKHSTMGRTKDKLREVEELLIKAVPVH